MKIFISFIIISLSIQIYGQVNTYTFSQQSNRLNLLHLENRLGNGQNPSLTSFLNENDIGGTSTKGSGIPIGFTFIYRGIPYDRFGVMNAGWLALGQSKYGSEAVDLGQLTLNGLSADGPENDTLRSRISALGAPIFANGNSSFLAYELQGEFPNRSLHVKWLKYRLPITSGTNYTNISFEIVLHETENSIEIIYGDWLTLGIVGNYSCNVGLSGLSKLEFLNRKTTANKDWNQTIKGNNFNDICLLSSSSILPENNLSFKFSPPSCFPILSVNFAQLTPNSVALNWQHMIQDTITYEYVFNQIAVSPASGSITTDSFVSFNNLTANTDYYFHIKNRCSISNHSIWKTYEIHTPCLPINLPYNEDFDGLPSNSLPECYAIINYEINSPSFALSQNTPMTSPNHLYIDWPENYNTDDLIFLPPVNLAADSSYLFSCDFNFGGGAYDEIYLVVGNSPIFKPENIIDTISITEITGTYFQYQKIFNVDSSQVYYVGLYTKDYCISIDNIYLNKNNCGDINNLGVTTNEVNNTVVSWDGGASSYEYYMSTNGILVEDDAQTTTADSIHFASLLPGSNYTLFIRKYCTTNERSLWQTLTILTKSAIDNCSSAGEVIPTLELDCVDTYLFSTYGASPSGQSNSVCGNTGKNDVWLTFNALRRSHKISIFDYCNNSVGGGTRTSNNTNIEDCTTYVVEFYKSNCQDLLLCDTIGSGLSIYYTQFKIDSSYKIRIYAKDTTNVGNNLGACITSFETPINDLCSGAINLTINEACNSFSTEYNLAGCNVATTPTSTCNAGPYYDVWFSFVAESSSHVIEALFSNGVDGVLELFSGSCASPNLIQCMNNTNIGSETFTASNLIIGNIYYIRAYDATKIGAASYVSVCVQNKVANDLCEDAINIALTSKTMLVYEAGSTFPSSGNGACNNNYADDDVWYKFVANQESHLIVVIPSFPNPEITNPVIELFGGSCSSNSVMCSNNGELFATNLTIGNTYYFRIYSQHQSHGKGNFRVCVIENSPTYRNCNTAFPLQINNDIYCDTTNTISCIGLGQNNEVWMKFVATKQSHIITCDGTQYGAPDGFAVYSSCNSTIPLVQEQSYGLIYYHNFVPGTTYFIKADRIVFPPNYKYIQDSLIVCVSTTIANDECTNAIEIEPNIVCNFEPFTSIGATPSMERSECMPNNHNYDVWYKFTATKTYLRIEVDGSYYEYIEVLDGCSGQQVACYHSTFSSSRAILHLNDLEIGHEYKVRVVASSPSTVSGQFQMCLVDAPDNDYCNNATELNHSLLKRCDPVQGTLINASESFGRKNVWYKFTAVSEKIIIKVSPSIKGFDPKMHLWNDDGQQLDNCTNTPVTFIDNTHLDYEPEVIIETGLVIGQTYYIEVYESHLSSNEGNFEICISGFDLNMNIHHANFESYKGDTLASAGSWHQPIAHGQIYYTGKQKSLTINEISFHLKDEAILPFIDKAYLYFNPNVYDANYSLPSAFNIFGKSGISIGLGVTLPPLLFSEIAVTNDTFIFKGNYEVTTNHEGQDLSYLRQHFYLLYDLKCNTPSNFETHAFCDEITLVNGDIINLYNVDSSGLLTGPLKQYDTKQNGDWTTSSTWMCNEVPPQHYDLPKININHDVVLSDTVNTGDIDIYFQRSLHLLPHSFLELGRSSEGPLVGFSNKRLDCEEGSLTMDSATLIVNGIFKFGDASGDQQGNGISGSGYYLLKQNEDTIAYRKDFNSYASHTFCVNDGVISKNVKEADIIYEFEKQELSNNRTRLPNTSYFLPLVMDDKQFQSLLVNRSSKLNLRIPFKDENSLEIELNETNIFDGTKLYTMPERQLINLPIGKFYRGKIKGNAKSLVSFGIFENEIIANIFDGNQTYELVQNEDESFMYALMHDGEGQNFICDASDEGVHYTINQLSQLSNASQVYSKCIKVLIEVEHDIILDKGGISSAYNYIASLFNNVATLYAQDSINLSASEILIWQNQYSPYTGTSMTAVLDKFSNNKNFYNGDLAILLSYQPNVGLGYINGLCNPIRKYSCAYASIDNSFASLPNYSWSTYVIAHELGHLLGSRHTHACVWNGNGTPLDGCFTNEGHCHSNELPEDGGTIMSYCHYLEGGINFNKGFGPQPKSVIYNNIINATCLNSCSQVSCLENEVVFQIKTDNNPNEIYWELVDKSHRMIEKGGRYYSPNTLFEKNICMPDGCYTLKMFDSSNEVPGGVLDIKNSKIILDGNDGTENHGLHSKIVLGIYNSNINFENVGITILDPSSLIFKPSNHGLYKLNGKLTIGGGDDNSIYQDKGFIIQGINVNLGQIYFDTVLVKGGLYNQNRHTSGLNYIGHLIVDENAEYVGSFGVDKDITNNGYITIPHEWNSFLSLGGKMDIGNHYINNSNSQKIQGQGFYRSSLLHPYHNNKNQNSINKLIINNSQSVDINTPLNISHDLILRNGIVLTDSINILSLGSINHQGTLYSDEENTIFYTSNETVIDSTVSMWNGGLINGPFIRYFNGATQAQHSIMPLGDSNHVSAIAFVFDSTSAGYIKAQYVSNVGSQQGLPLFEEQATNIMAASPSGYWKIDSNGVSGKYSVHVNALGFEEAPNVPVSDISQSRVIKSNNGVWQHSNSSTHNGPSTLSEVSAENLIGLTDIGIGIGQDTNLCGLWVYKNNDHGKGSLRYTLDSCATMGSIIKIVASIDTIYLSVDSLFIDKNVGIIGLNEEKTIVQGSLEKKVFEIAPNMSVSLSNIQLRSSSNPSIPTLKNYGVLTLNNVIISEKNGHGKVYNTAILKVDKDVKIE